MGCKKLKLTEYFRLTPTTESQESHNGCSTGSSETPNTRFKPVVSVSISAYRYYSPELGRWTKRDDIGEQGGENLYNMVENGAINLNDLYGYGSTITFFVPEDPSSIVPRRKKLPMHIRRDPKTGRIQTGQELGFTDASLLALCKCNTACDLNCGLIGYFSIDIHTTIPKGHTIDGIKGHEQRHVKSIMVAMEKLADANTPLPSFSTMEECENEKMTMELLLNRLLRQIRAAAAKHKGENEALPGAPIEGKDHPPLKPLPPLFKIY